MHKQAPVSSELVELSLGVVGWLVAFLLGQELASGYMQWRRRRDENQRRMLVQQWSHMLIIGLILLGNVAYVLGRRRGAVA